VAAESKDLSVGSIGETSERGERFFACGLRMTRKAMLLTEQIGWHILRGRLLSPQPKNLLAISTGIHVTNKEILHCG